jgi:hypothetical protein
MTRRRSKEEVNCYNCVDGQQQYELLTGHQELRLPGKNCNKQECGILQAMLNYSNDIRTLMRIQGEVAKLKLTKL